MSSPSNSAHARMNTVTNEASLLDEPDYLEWVFVCFKMICPQLGMLQEHGVQTFSCKDNSSKITSIPPMCEHSRRPSWRGRLRSCSQASDVTSSEGSRAKLSRCMDVSLDMSSVQVVLHSAHAAGTGPVSASNRTFRNGDLSKNQQNGAPSHASHMKCSSLKYVWSIFPAACGAVPIILIPNGQHVRAALSSPLERCSNQINGEPPVGFLPAAAVHSSLATLALAFGKMFGTSDCILSAPAVF